MIAATLYRGDIVENTHAAHVAVVDAHGALLHSFGDPHRVTLPHSAGRQARAGAPRDANRGTGRFGFDDADLALMCGSHSSEAHHSNALARGALSGQRAARRRRSRYDDASPKPSQEFCARMPAGGVVAERDSVVRGGRRRAHRKSGCHKSDKRIGVSDRLLLRRAGMDDLHLHGSRITGASAPARVCCARVTSCRRCCSRISRIA